MKSKKVSILLGVVIFFEVAVLAYLLLGGPAPVGNATLEVNIVTGGCSLDCGFSPGDYELETESYTGKVEIVLTEPFKSLPTYESAKVIKSVSTSSGYASIRVNSGKYGLYFVINGQKQLYNNLELTPYDVQANPGPRGERGDWYIDIQGEKSIEVRP